MVAALSNCTVVEQRAMILSLSLSFHPLTGLKTSAAGDSQQAQMFSVQELLLLHNNALPHSAVAAVEAIRRLKFELLPHFPYKRSFAYTNICR